MTSIILSKTETLKPNQLIMKTSSDNGGPPTSSPDEKNDKKCDVSEKVST